MTAPAVIHRPSPPRISWFGFSRDQADTAWDRLADAVARGTGPEIQAARVYLVNGPAR